MLMDWPIQIAAWILRKYHRIPPIRSVAARINTCWAFRAEHRKQTSWRGCRGSSGAIDIGMVLLGGLGGIIVIEGRGGWVEDISGQILQSATAGVT